MRWLYSPTKPSSVVAVNKAADPARLICQECRGPSEAGHSSRRASRQSDDADSVLLRKRAETLPRMRTRRGAKDGAPCLRTSWAPSVAKRPGHTSDPPAEEVGIGTQSSARDDGTGAGPRIRVR